MKAIIKRACFYSGRVFKKGDIVEHPNLEALAQQGIVEIIEEQIETEAIEKPEKKVKKKTSKKKKIEE